MMRQGDVKKNPVKVVHHFETNGSTSLAVNVFLDKRIPTTVIVLNRV